MKSQKCQNCGAELKKINDSWFCAHCKKTYYDDSLEKAYEKVYQNLRDTVQGIVADELVKRKIEEIANCRWKLYQERKGNFIEPKEIGRWSDEILKLSPDDVQANFYSIASKKRWVELNEFMKNLDKNNAYYHVEGFVDYLTNGRFAVKCKKQLQYLVDRTFEKNSKEYTNCHKKIENAEEKYKSKIGDPKVPRDIFVAYSSKDEEKAKEIVEYLEAREIECYVSYRNLPKGVDAPRNYGKDLRKAIDSCLIFLFISTVNSRSETCDAFNMELEYVKKKDLESLSRKENNYYLHNYGKFVEKDKGKPRIQYRLDGYDDADVGINDEINQFFRGLTWCKTKEEVYNQVRQIDDVLLQEPLSSKETNKTQEDKFEIVYENGEVKLTKYNANELTVIIPDGVTIIDENVFVKKSMEEVRLPLSLRKIGYCAFKDCNALEKITFDPKGSNLEEIAAYAFKNCGNLNDFKFPNSLRKICQEAFFKCESLKEARVGVNVKTVNSNAFAGCKNLTIYVYALKKPTGWKEDWNPNKRPVNWGYRNNQVNSNSTVETNKSKANIPQTPVKETVRPISQPVKKEKTKEDICKEGVEYYRQKDYETAVDRFRKSANLGYAEAQSNLGVCYYNGTGVSKDYNEAVKNFRLAAEQNNAIAQCSLGICYYNGTGVDKDYEEAISWLEKAEKQGNQKAKEYLDEIDRKIQEPKNREKQSFDSGEKGRNSDDLRRQSKGISEAAYQEAKRVLTDVEKNFSGFNSSFFADNTNPKSKAKDFANGNEILRIKNGIKNINGHLFQNLQQKIIIIPESVEEINDWAFQNCLNLEEVIFSDNGRLRNINDWAFQNCTKLRIVKLPKTRKVNINDWAFSNCPDLSEISGEYEIKGDNACASSLKLFCE